MLSPVSSTMSSAFPKERMGRLPACFVPRITTSRRSVFRGCRYSLMFRPPSLLSPQIVPTAAILLQGSRGFYVRAYRALLPPHAPDMLTVRIQVIDGAGTFTLSDSQPCRLLTSLPRRYSASSVLRTSPHPRGARPVPRGHPVGHRWPHLRASRVAYAFLVYMLSPLPRRSSWGLASLVPPAVSAFPERVIGSACASSFSRLARRSLALRPAHSRCHQFVTR